MNHEDPPSPVDGADGELIGRFVLALRRCASYDTDWSRAATLGLALALPCRGTVRGPQGLRLDVLADQLEALVAAGLTEDLLIRAARDEVTRATEQYADTATINARREHMAEVIDEMHADPTVLDRMRRPEDLLVTDDELRDELRRTRARLDPIGPDEAARSWTWSSRWAVIRDAHISDADFDEWVAARHHVGRRPWRG